MCLIQLKRRAREKEGEKSNQLKKTKRESERERKQFICNRKWNGTGLWTHTTRTTNIYIHIMLNKYTTLESTTFENGKRVRERERGKRHSQSRTRFGFAFRSYSMHINQVTNTRYSFHSRSLLFPVISLWYTYIILRVYTLYTRKSTKTTSTELPPLSSYEV